MTSFYRCRVSHASGARHQIESSGLKNSRFRSNSLKRLLTRNVGSFDRFREIFSTAAATRFGSGWAWLVKTGGGLAVTSTPNQDNPLMDVTGVQGFPLLAIDVWEHAYYLKYQNRRTDYIKAFWNVVDWDFVAHRFSK